MFTSQGCSSCPPAERVLAELAGNEVPPDRVIPLAFHVDYWDHLGWKDPYSSLSFSTRQWQYARTLRLKTVYTPQIVVDGKLEMLGSHKSKVLAAIRSRLADTPAVSISIQVDTAIAGKARLRIQTGFADTSAGPGWLYAATFIPEAVTRVPAGENAGRTIRQVNIVRAMSEPVPVRAAARPQVTRLDLPFSPSDAVAAWIQDGRTFAVRQAAVWRN